MVIWLFLQKHFESEGDYYQNQLHMQVGMP